jgi:hypothetical protein
VWLNAYIANSVTYKLVAGGCISKSIKHILVNLLLKSDAWDATGLKAPVMSNIADCNIHLLGLDINLS